MIDLSRLARQDVPGLLREPDALLAEYRAWLTAQYGWTLDTADAADPAVRLLRLWAARETLLRRAVGDALAQASLAYAGGANLDHIGATYYALSRLTNETDHAFRARLSAAPELAAIGLSGPWYEGKARGVDGVDDAYVTSPAPGAVKVSILASETAEDAQGNKRWPNGVPDGTLLTAVRAALTADAARQQTDTVTVVAATRQRVDLTVALTLLSAVDAATVRAAAEARLRVLALRLRRIGEGVGRDLVAGAAVDPVAVASAVITIGSVSAGDVVTNVDSIAAADHVSLQLRTLVVTASA